MVEAPGGLESHPVYSALHRVEAEIKSDDKKELDK